MEKVDEAKVALEIDEKEKKKPEIKLNVDELKLLSQILFNSKWNGQEWEKTITPLINKIAKIIDQTKK